MRTQLPSLGDAVTAARQTLKRFPAVLLAAGVCAAAAVLTIDEVGPEALQLRLLATASLALPLLTAVTLFAEHRERRASLLILRLGGAVLLAGFYLAWPSWSDPVRAGRYCQLSVAFHLLAAFLPFAGRPLANAFWQFNRALFTRFIAAAVSSGTLYVGLSLALLAVDKLFGVDVPEQGYFRLWAVIAFVFNTWFFLGSVPEDLDALEEQRDYPAALRVFAQYTLVPLVSVYLVILTLYLGKVVVTWDWPSGWIGWLVSGVAGAGILALLLVHPAAADPEQRWVAAFARQFWLAILPSVAMLWMALYQRVDQYGITERRYFLIALSVWLAGLALYYGISRSRNIRIVPASLCLVALLTIAGPWSAYAVSRGSQVGRLRAILGRNGVLVDGRVRRAPREVAAADAREISAVLRYLAEAHGTRSIAPWFDDSLARRAEVGGGPAGVGRPSAAAARRIVTALGIPYHGPGRAGTEGEGFTYSAAGGAAIPLAGYDWLLSIRGRRDSAGTRDTGLVARAVPGARAVMVMRDGAPLVVVSLDSMLARLKAAGGRPYRTVPPGLLRAEAESAGVRALVYVTSVSGRHGAGRPVVSSVVGDVLVRLRR